MTLVRIYSTSRLRHGWRACLALVLIAGVSGGAVLALVAGARRSESAYPRFLARYRGADSEIFFNGSPSEALAHLRKVAALPAVAAHGFFTGYTASQATTAILPLDNGFETTVNVPKVLSGRLPAADQPTEIALNFTYADAHHLRVGDQVRLTFTGNASPNSGSVPSLPLEMQVVGVTATALQFPPIALGQGDEILLSGSFVKQFEARLGPPGVALAVRLRDGRTTIAEFQREITKISPDAPVLAQDTRPQITAIRQSIHPEAVALWLLAACLALVVALILFQLITRQSFLEAEQYPTLKAMGASRAQIIGIELARGTVVALLASALAVATAIAASPIFPLGVAKVAEPNPGVSVDGRVVVLGGIAVAVVMMLLALRPAWTAARASTAIDAAEPMRSSRRKGNAWDLPGRLRFGPVPTVGVAHALRSGRGRSAVPTRASIVSLIIGVTSLVAALTFGASLAHVLDTPRLYGWTWDAQIFDLGSRGTAQLASQLRSEPWISSATLADSGIPLSINGLDVDGLGLQPVKGDIELVSRSGGDPSGVEQIALGSTTMRKLGVHLGDRVRVVIPVVAHAPTRTMTVIGSVIVPPSSYAGHLGDGAVMSESSLQTLVPKTVQDVPPPGTVFIRFAPGEMTPAHLATLRQTLGAEYLVLGAQPPTDILNFGRVQNLPTALGLVLAVLALATLTTTVVSSTRRRSSELAILKTIGYRPAQIRGVVAWQATTLAIIGCTLGVPLGIALGRVLWGLVANQLGTVVDSVIPGVGILAVVAAVLLVSNLAAVVPGYWASRLQPARALRNG